MPWMIINEARVWSGFPQGLLLIRAGWNELLIASFSHRSVSVQDGILLATGLHVHRSSAHSAGVGSIFDRWLYSASGACMCVCVQVCMCVCVYLWVVLGCRMDSPISCTGWKQRPLST